MGDTETFIKALEAVKCVLLEVATPPTWGGAQRGHSAGGRADRPENLLLPDRYFGAMLLCRSIPKLTGYQGTVPGV